MSSLKETLAFPLAVWLDPVSATQALFAILRVASRFLLYWLFARRFAAPAAAVPLPRIGQPDSRTSG